MPDQSVNVTRLLDRLTDGDRQALDQLFPVVYDELCRLAHLQLRGKGKGNTLKTTALVHEAYFKLVDYHQVDWQDRNHFFAVASRAMRQVLVERARKRNAKKRGGGQRPLTLEEQLVGAPEQDEAIVLLDSALDKLEELDERQAKVVECRFFAGMTIEETAAVLDVSPATVKRDWRTAKAWLFREMKKEM